MADKVDPALIARLTVAGARPLPPATHTAEVNPIPITGFAGGFGLGPTNTRLDDPQLPKTGIAYPPPPANGQLAAALAKAQAEMKPAVFNRINPHYKSRYADLAAVIEAARPLSKHGLSYTQIMVLVPEFMLVTTLHHSSGETISSYYPLPRDVDEQKKGSALTYAARYSLARLVGIAADEDDDAEAASKVDNSPVTPEQIEHLKILIDSMETGVEARLLTYMGTLLKRKITKLEDIPAAQFPTAFAVLEKKRTGKASPKEPPK